jgi:iron complex transport system substrate-binding protein
VLTLTPHTLADVWNDIRRVGAATVVDGNAETLAAQLAARVTATNAITRGATSRPRVLCLEWLDPFYVGGHWVPEMVAQAGGEDVLGRAGEPSYRVTAEQIAQSGAEIIVVMPCGYNAARAAAEFKSMRMPQAWDELPAIRSGMIFAVDANSHFSRPGPRLAESVEMLAHVVHPELFPADFPVRMLQCL